MEDAECGWELLCLQTACFCYGTSDAVLRPALRGPPSAPSPPLQLVAWLHPLMSMDAGAASGWGWRTWPEQEGGGKEKRKDFAGGEQHQPRCLAAGTCAATSCA